MYKYGYKYVNGLLMNCG